jgi:acyl homoserine lactone synthase
MIIVVQKINAYEHADLLDQMFQTRARVFGDKLNWDVEITEGREFDKYDDMGPVYILHTDEAATTVKASLRLLPTTGPTVLADFFSDTMPDAAHLSAPGIWECTRFCVDEDVVGYGHREQILASGALIAGLGEVAITAGIDSILGNFDSAMLRLYRRIGCEVEILGATHRYANPVYLGLFPVSDAILSNVRSRLKSASPVLGQLQEDGELAAA